MPRRADRHFVASAARPVLRQADNRRDLTYMLLREGLQMVAKSDSSQRRTTSRSSRRTRGFEDAGKKAAEAPSTKKHAAKSRSHAKVASDQRRVDAMLKDVR